ncbi:hypothetical protein DFH94DRAFT_796235 [Russula ochroleuca]|uniref:Serine protease n=1 Tax=Russula ochroleuca TaxID=152965 RepID=A0A9P5JW52_9AGAM|nr:hypothetical protein DFH94DRAFT_796235 [Russula ochroleuca]
MPSHSPVDEAHNDYYDLPSNPISIFHTGPAWPLPTGIDPVRFAEAGGEPGPLFLWVGVIPRTLSRDDAEVAALRCKNILAEYEIMDVEIAFRESVFTRSTRPQHLDHVPSLRSPNSRRTQSIHSRSGSPYRSQGLPFEGTGCLYLCEGDQVLLLTARHVALLPSKHSNDLYHRKNNSMPRLEVTHPGSNAYQTALEAIMGRIGRETTVIDHYKDEIDALGAAAEDEDAEITAGRASAFWDTSLRPSNSVSTGDKRFTEDRALVELDRGKFNWNAFRGNVIHLGTKITAGGFREKMYPHPETCAQFKYPRGGLMKFRDFVKDGELRRPTIFDANREECLIVVKNGTSTGVTFGRTTSIESFVCDYKEYRIHSTSMEITIYPYSHKDGAFSAPGGSGSVISDANNRIVGMLTGGAGQTDSTDVTYASQYYFLDERIKKAFPNSHLYPIPPRWRNSAARGDSAAHQAHDE